MKRKKIWRDYNFVYCTGMRQYVFCIDTDELFLVTGLGHWLQWTCKTLIYLNSIQLFLQGCRSILFHKCVLVLYLIIKKLHCGLVALKFLCLVFDGILDFVWNTEIFEGVKLNKEHINGRKSVIWNICWPTQIRTDNILYMDFIGGFLYFRPLSAILPYHTRF